MTTFALVHGAWHGAWCWERLTPLLQGASHDVVALDLPCDDGSATFDDYADVVCEALAGRDDVVLVGHSQGGHTVPLVAVRRPLRHLVYLGAMIPDIGRSLFDQLEDKPQMLNPAYQKGLSEPDDQMRQSWVDLEIATALFYHDCDEPTAHAALERLRPQAIHPATLPTSLKEFPSVSTSYILCTEDQILNPEWSRHVARDRLNADFLELPGGHSPMLSRPSALADLLLRFAA